MINVLDNDREKGLLCCFSIGRNHLQFMEDRRGEDENPDENPICNTGIANTNLLIDIAMCC